ncbi:MAG TPA: hypothetical protein PK025_07880 [Spirochaetales bacterium]|nr:hypothetical protein [Spirochaetales bacterium]
MKKLFYCIVIFIIVSASFSCVTTSNAATSQSSKNRPSLFSFLPIEVKTAVVPSKEKLITSTPQSTAFTDIKQIPQEKIVKLINTVGINTQKTFKPGETLYSFINGQVIEVDTTGSTAWGKYILIEGSYKYFLSDGEKNTKYRILICYLADIAPDIKPMITIKPNMILGTINIDSAGKSTNILLFTPDTQDVFLNFSTPTYPVDFRNNRWFHISTLLNQNSEYFFKYPEWSPYEAAYTFCHWHDPETGEERRDPPPPNFSEVTFIQSGCRFSLQLEKRPYLLTAEEQQHIENKLNIFRSVVAFGDFVSVTTWKDKDYTYYLFWGPRMNGYIQEEWEPQKLVTISAAIITADVVTNSLVLYVSEFSYKPISQKLDLVKNTVLKFED